MEKLADQRAQLDAEIRDLEARIISLRATRNTLAPINQFPVEILVKIFVAVLKGTAVVILPITRVSRHWRHIALSCAELWSDVDNSVVKGGYTASWLERSRALPLSIRISGDLAYHKPHLSLILAQSNRIARLRLDGHHPSPEDLGRVWASPDTSSLKELYLRNCKIPSRVFTSSASTLQFVLLQTCRFDFASAFTTSSCLTTLSIVLPADLIDANVFLKRLAWMPALKNLVLDRAVSKTDEDLTQVSMPNLQLDSLILRRMSIKTQNQFLEQQDLIRPKTSVVLSFLASPRVGLEEFIYTIRRAVSTGFRAVTSVDIVEVGDGSHQGYRVSVVYEASHEGPARGIGNVHLIINMPTEKIILDVLTSLDIDSASEHLRVVRVFQLNLGESQWTNRDLPPTIAEFIGNLTQVQHIHLRAPFPFTKAFLLACAQAHKDSGNDIGILETVTIKTSPPPLWESVVDTCGSKKPINTLVLEHSEPIVAFAAFAERVVLAGTKSHDQVHVEFPIQVSGLRFGIQSTSISSCRSRFNRPSERTIFDSSFTKFPCLPCISAPSQRT
ncbi:hypothetical protein BDN72DRAFT_957708 [Pluteus cervinus]|uniref:Uncharacterized protein n=1 Tax=Pluteus cervinus TaxID=181527 RepID=A0ACD3B1X8_9AGAR|nr:hypothetical protein BDN72DRAFT_957708 [Pluteus cervinus]